MSYNFAHHTKTEQDVTRAIYENSLERLQQISLRPRGFRDARIQAWTFLLGIELSSISKPKFVSPQSGRDSSLSESWTQSSPPSPPKDLEPSSNTPREEDPLDVFEHLIDASSHPDAHQVQLDTNRSFILYPVENHSMDQRKSLQEGLHDIILGVLQKRSRLRYFQGYHDIMTVLFLTLPTEIVPQAAEKMSLYRLRDSMGSGLDPLVGQLRILKRLIRIVDPSYAEILEKNSPLPYHALSNLLTLFSHDVPTLPLIQHVFDWLLCREPIASIWLAAAVILSRKQDILVLEQEGEEAMGMMHAVLSALPSLSDGDSDDESQDDHLEVQGSSEDSPATNEVMGAEKYIELDSSNVLGFEEKPAETVTVATVSEAGEDQDEKTHISSNDIQPVTNDSNANTGTLSPTSDSSESWTADMPRAFSSPVVPIADMVSNSASEGSKPAFVTEDDHLDGEDENFRSSVTPETEIHSRRDSSSPSRSRSPSRSPPGYYQEKRPPPPLPLSTLLHQASELLVKYPPSTPELHVTETFGPQSALHPSRYYFGTLSNLDDDEAETCVGGDDVVLPPTQEEREEEAGPPRKPRESGRRPKPGKERWRPGKSVTIRRQTVVAGVVILIGVAVALYGFGPGGRGSARNSYRFGGEKRVVAWVGGLLGIGQRLAIGI